MQHEDRGVADGLPPADLADGLRADLADGLQPADLDGTLSVDQCSPITKDPAGCVKAVCTSWPKPQVQLTWCDQPGQTANSVQRSICCPGDPGFGWVAIWGDSTLLLRTWTDTTVVAGVSYTYRIKFKPELASNTINVPVTACNCGG